MGGGSPSRTTPAQPPSGAALGSAQVRDGSKRIVRLKEGEPKDRHVVIVDDLVQSGGTLIECHALLASLGAKHGVWVAALAAGFAVPGRGCAKPDGPMTCGWCVHVCVLGASARMHACMHGCGSVVRHTAPGTCVSFGTGHGPPPRATACAGQAPTAPRGFGGSKRVAAAPGAEMAAAAVAAVAAAAAGRPAVVRSSPAGSPRTMARGMPANPCIHTMRGAPRTTMDKSMHHLPCMHMHGCMPRGMSGPWWL